MFRLKEIDPWEEKRKKAIDKLLNEGEKFKKNSLEKWNKKINKSEKK
ncbi:MAG: hypothetical protein ACTSRI_09895 [Promethearchaeota archaeon]